MKLLELHILQSFPVSCLNRDDAGIPKIAIFGGVTRARISSQCLKRAVREEAQTMNDGAFKGIRTKYIGQKLGDEVKKLQPNADPDCLSLAVEGALAAFGKVDEAAKDRIKALYFLAPAELRAVAAAVAAALDDKPDDWSAYCTAKSKAGGQTPAEKAAPDKKAAKALDDARKKLIDGVKRAAEKALRDCKGRLKDAIDIALFGRMAADSPDLNIDGAACFSHALSTHEAEPQQDFYSAVDEVLREKMENREEDAHAGSGMLGIIEFTSATYYRYAALNLDMLFAKENGYLRDLAPAEQAGALNSFIQAVVKAVPRARKTGMNAHTRPAYVLGCVRQHGGPVQLVNAFEAPVRAGDGGFVKTSVDKLLQHFCNVNEVWELDKDGNTLALAATGEIRLQGGGTPEHLPISRFAEKLTEAAVPA